MSCERRIRFTKHAKERIMVRGIKIEAVLEVLEKPDYKFFDTSEDTIVYISERDKLIVVITPEECGGLKVVTVIPCTRVKASLKRRIHSSRWIPLE